MDNILKPEKIPLLWPMSLVLISSLLIALYFDTLSTKVASAQYNLTSNSVFDFVLQLQFVSTVVMTFAIWLVSSFLFHLYYLEGKLILRIS